MIGEIIVFLTVLLVSSFYYSRRKYQNFPPGTSSANFTGPYGLPIVGYLPFMGTNPHTKYGELGKKYGKIFSVTFGSLPIVVLNDLELIRTAFKKDAFQGRPKSVLAMAITSDGISFNEGVPWYEQRRFTLKILRELGFGRSSLENSIHEEVEDLIAFFKTQTGKPISLKHTFEIAVINTLWNIVASKKYKLDDPEAIYMHKICYEGFIEPEVAGAVYFIPWVAKLFPEWTGYNALKLAVKNMLKIFQDMVDERQKTYSPDQMNDFVDFYLKEIANTKDPKSSFYKEEGIKNLVHVLLDLFTAGSDTTSSTLCWTFLYLLTYPEVMAKVQQEVDTVVGRQELPTLADRIKMPYTDATMCEIFRMSSIVCGALLHSTLIDTEFEGFFLPKGTIVMGNLYHVHHDPGYWGDPENFRPDRFLTPEGILRKDDALMPFSTGKRICPAESLASTNFFLFFTALIQKFEFHIDPNHPLPSLDAKAGLVLATQPYKVVLRNRT